MAGNSICEINLQSLIENGTLDISQSGTPCRYRLIDCADFISADKLTIREYIEFPTFPYAAASYVWRGNEPDQEFAGPVFSVKGAENADPIGLEVLREACKASTAHGANHIWLDRLCIMQTDKEDKRWQIKEMYKMYHSCHICVVAPGGVQRLVRLDEETQWIHRGWTLQEAVAPPNVIVLFSWKLGDREARVGNYKGAFGLIKEVTPLKSAVMPLSLIVDASSTGTLSIEIGDKPTDVKIKLFSSLPSDRSYNDFPFWQPTRQILPPNVGALARIMGNSHGQDVKEHSIWQSALMRTSSRPVDMVFSIMGLFGVALDTSKFGQNDRVPATIALAREILAKGGRANWLAAAFRIPPSKQISTFPVFPRTSVAGKAFVEVAHSLQEVSSLMENEYPIAEALAPTPHATMNEEGYICFTAKAVQLESSSADAADLPSDPVRSTHREAIDGSWWKICEEFDDAKGQVFAVLIGFFVGYYPGSTPAHDADNIRTMLIEEHAPGKFHVRSYLKFSMKAKGWAEKWSERSFCVGGPDVNAIEDTGEELPIKSVPREQYLKHPRDKHPIRTLEDEEVRRSRWAISQKFLERKYALRPDQE